MPCFADIICDIFHVDSLLPSKFSNNELKRRGKLGAKAVPCMVFAIFPTRLAFCAAKFGVSNHFNVFTTLIWCYYCKKCQ
jgi:hypothetical protein